MPTHPLRVTIAALVVAGSIAISYGVAPEAAARPALPAGPAAPAAPADGEKDSPNPDQQEQDSELVGWLNESGFAERGFVVSVYNADDQSLTLRWKGLAEDDQNVVLEQARVLGVTVGFSSAKYSLAEIKETQQAIAGRAGELSAQGFTLQSISGVANADEGLVVTGQFAAGANKSSVLSEINAATRNASSIPISIEEGDVVATAATRSKDVETFNAGGYMRDTSTTLTCSVAFGITINGTFRTTTARHCKGTDYNARDNFATDYGSTVTTSGDGAARVLSEGGSYWMFTGAWNNTSGSKKKVAGYRDVSLNDSVCTSGGNSGQHCDIIINDMNEWWDDGDGGFDNIRGTRAAGIATATGDSGGPVFTSRSDGRVGAVGMMQALSDQITCPSIHDPGNICGRTVLFSSMRTIVNTIPGASLRTST